jgi:hypothetical protein
MMLVIFPTYHRITNQAQKGIMYNIDHSEEFYLLICSKAKVVYFLSFISLYFFG